MLVAYDDHGPRTEYIVNQAFPPSDRLSNFVVADYLVLDMYGCDEMSDEMWRRVFGLARECPVAISSFGRIGFLSQGEDHVWDFVPLGYGVVEEGFALPASFCVRRMELLNKKRPVNLTFLPHALVTAFEGEEGVRHLRENLVVEFDFDNERLQLTSDQFRVCSPWRCLPELQPDAE